MKTSLRAIVRNGTLVLGAAAFLAPAVSATWSIVAVNTRTGEVCIASATCIEDINLQGLTPVVLVGLGGACAQSAGDGTGLNRQRIHDDLLAGMSPEQILADLAAHDGQHHKTRQYGIVNMADEPLTFSGNLDGQAYYGVARVQDDIRYAIQGNVLTGVQVITNAENAFLSTQGDLGQKTIAAMEAARVFGGDGRCSCNDGAPTYCGCPPHRFFYSAYTGFFVIARMGDTDGATCGVGGCATGTYFCDLLSISHLHGQEPVIDLENQYAVWRTGKAGVADHIRTRVTPFATRIPADGATQIPVDVELRDIDGNPVTANPATLTVVDVSQGPPTATIGTVQQTGPGLFSFPLTSNGALGEGRYRITVHHASGDVLLWPELVVRADPTAELFSGYSVVSSSDGAGIPLWLDSGAGSAGNHYLMIASTSGTVPGTTFGGVHVPLNVDRAFRTSVASAGSAHYLSTIGNLDANGRATGIFVASPNMLYPLVGRHFDWSAVVSGTPDHATLPDGFDVAP